MVLAVPVSSFAAGDVYDTDEPNVTVPIHEEDLNAVEKELVKMDGPLGDKFRELANILTVQPEYWTKNAVKGHREKKFAKKGSYKVSFHLETSKDEHIQQYSVWYPTKLKSSTKAWPVVVWVNGGGVPVSDYKPVLDHMASWGFIVIGCEDADSACRITSSLCCWWQSGNRPRRSISWRFRSPARPPTIAMKMTSTTSRNASWTMYC